VKLRDRLREFGRLLLNLSRERFCFLCYRERSPVLMVLRTLVNRWRHTRLLLLVLLQTLDQLVMSFIPLRLVLFFRFFTIMALDGWFVTYAGMF
jgi:hypothetical protein